MELGFKDGERGVGKKALIKRTVKILDNRVHIWMCVENLDPLEVMSTSGPIFIFLDYVGRFLVDLVL